MSVQCDYLVLGAGAQGIAFTDALLAEMPGANVVIVDKRSSPGGMWNDTYAFAKLDQPATCYGLCSKVPLAGTPPKRGEVSERATKSEVLLHFKKCMTHLVKNHSVRYFPNYSAQEVGRAGDREAHVLLTSTLIASKTMEVTVRRKVVDTGFGSVPLPLSSRPFPFDADAGVRIVRPHELTYSGTAAKPMYVVIGAGKTGLDTVLFLLSRNVPAEKVRWIVPRHSWYFVAEAMEQEGYADTVITFDSCVATADSTEDLYLKLEAAKKLCRIDERHFPEVFHCINMSKADLASVRAVPAIHMGRVQKVTPDRLILEHGSTPVEKGALFIDCTGNGRNRVQEVAPVFSLHKIRLQRVAEYSVGAGEMSAPFCAAVVGHLEATYPGNAQIQNNLCTPAPFPDHYNDWIKYQQVRKQKHETMLEDRRLSVFLLGHAMSRFHRMTTAEIRKIIANYEELPHARENIDRITPAVNYSRLLQDAPDTPARAPPISEDEAAKGAIPAGAVDAIKEKLAFLMAEQERLRKRMLTIQAANDELKQSVSDAEAKQQKAEAYLKFFEGDDHPAHRLQQLKKDMATLQHGPSQPSLRSYLKFSEGDDHPAHRVQQLKKDMTTI